MIVNLKAFKFKVLYGSFCVPKHSVQCAQLSKHYELT